MGLCTCCRIPVTAVIPHGHHQSMRALTAPTHNAAPNPPSKIRRQRMRDTSASAASESPPQYTPHPHPYRRSESTSTHSFRASSADQQNTICAVCLSRPHPEMAECRKDKLSDGDPAYSTRSKLGHLVDLQGKSLCLDFQLRKGCSSTRHGTRHRCSGCGSEQHGATNCPRRPSN
jgi:hypothetical protein